MNWVRNLDCIQLFWFCQPVHCSDPCFLGRNRDHNRDISFQLLEYQMCWMGGGFNKLTSPLAHMFIAVVTAMWHIASIRGNATQNRETSSREGGLVTKACDGKYAFYCDAKNSEANYHWNHHHHNDHHHHDHRHLHHDQNKASLLEPISGASKHGRSNYYPLTLSSLSSFHPLNQLNLSPSQSSQSSHSQSYHSPLQPNVRYNHPGESLKQLAPAWRKWLNSFQQLQIAL